MIFPVRCQQCGAVFEGYSIVCSPSSPAICNRCGAQEAGVKHTVALATGCKTYSQIGHAFGDIERFDCVVNEVILLPETFYRLRKEYRVDLMDWPSEGIKIGEHGRTNVKMWNATVCLRAPPGIMFVWDECEILNT